MRPQISDVFCTWGFLVALAPFTSAHASPPPPPPPPAERLQPAQPSPLSSTDRGEFITAAASSCPAPTGEAKQPPVSSSPPRNVRPELPLRGGLAAGAVVSYTTAVLLDVVGAAHSADCDRTGDASASGRCRSSGQSNLGLGLGALAFHVTSFSMAASFGYVQGRVRAQSGPLLSRRRSLASAWAGGLLVSVGLAGTALSGLATQDACSDGCDSGRAVLASVLRSTSTLATNLGVGLLTWREGVRRWNTSLAFGHGHVGAALTVRF